MIKRLSAIIFALSCGVFPLSGQTPAALEMNKMSAVWFNSNNASGMTLTSVAPFEAIGVNYHITDGDYRSYTEGNRRDLVIDVEGATSLWKGKVWGEFTYKNITERDTRFNTMFLNMDEDNPFFVADDEPSWWKKQKYEMAMKASTPAYWDRLCLGIQASYFTESGAKQIDPRGYGSEYGITVKPGALLKLGASSIGLALDYEGGNMRMTPINNAYMNSKAAYIMRGLGNNESTVISLLATGVGQVFDKKNQYGASLQYGYSGGSLSLLADLYATLRDWNLLHTPNRPEEIGSTVRKDLGANIQIVQQNAKYMHRVLLDGSQKFTDGIEYIQVFNKDYNVQAYETVARNIKSKYSHTEGSLSYDIFRKAPDGYDWTAGALVNYYARNDRYIIPVSTFSCAQLYSEVHAAKRFHMRKLSLTAGAEIGCCSGRDSKYYYQGTSANTSIVTDYFPHEAAVKSADYYSAGFDLKISVPVSQKNVLFLSTRAKMLETDNDLMKSRSIADISLGVLF